MGAHLWVSLIVSLPIVPTRNFDLLSLIPKNQPSQDQLPQKRRFLPNLLSKFSVNLLLTQNSQDAVSHQTRQRRISPQAFPHLLGGHGQSVPLVHTLDNQKTQVVDLEDSVHDRITILEVVRVSVSKKPSRQMSLESEHVELQRSHCARDARQRSSSLSLFSSMSGEIFQTAGHESEIVGEECSGELRQFEDSLLGAFVEITGREIRSVSFEEFCCDCVGDFGIRVGACAGDDGDRS